MGYTLADLHSTLYFFNTLILTEEMLLLNVIFWDIAAEKSDTVTFVGTQVRTDNESTISRSLGVRIPRLEIFCRTQSAENTVLSCIQLEEINIFVHKRFTQLLPKHAKMFHEYAVMPRV